MGNNKTLGMLEDLKSRISASNSGDIKIIPTAQPINSPILAPKFDFPDPEPSLDAKKELVVLPWLLQSAWLPSKGAPESHIRSFRNLSIVSQGALLPSGQNIGLPSGLIARRILLALTTIATQRQSKVIEVPSISWLLDWTRLKASGRQHKQIQRNLYRMALMATNIFIAPRGEDKKYEVHSGNVFDSLSIELGGTDQQTFSFIPKEVSFTDRFYEKVIENQGVAYDADMILEAPSPFIHDLMLWLVHRQTSPELLNRELFLTYEALLPQFGRREENIRKFRMRMKKALGYIEATHSRGLTITTAGVKIPHKPKSLRVYR